MKTLPGLALTLAVAACGDDQRAQEAPAPAPAPAPTSKPAPKQPRAAPESPNQVDLTFEGGVTAVLKGAGGRCDKGLGASFSVRSDELGVTPSFELAILVTSEEGWASPTIVLNVREPRASFARNTQRPPEGETLELARDHTAATIDTSLFAIAGGEPVKVKGTIRCPAK